MPGIFNKNSRIADKLFYGIIAVLTLVLGLLGSVIIHTRVAEVGKRIEMRAETTANYLEDILHHLVKSLDAKHIREDIENVATNDLQAMEIFDQKGERIYVYERAGSDKVYDKKIVRVLTKDETSVGSFAAYFSIGKILATYKTKEFLRLIILISAVGLCLAIGIYYLAKKIVIKPISETLAFSKSLAAGNYGERIDVSANDEMGMLQKSLNNMADLLVEAVENLKASFYEAEGARLQALEASRLKSEFLASMSHEVRTPVNAIVGFADLLLEKESDEEKREHLKTIKKSAQILLDNINDILDFSKIEAGKLNISKSPVLISELIEEISPIIKLRLHGKNVIFDKKISPDLESPLLCDRVRLRQVLLNILINSAKFTRMGSITLSASKDNGNEILFKITDTGIGIPKEHHTKIFEPFIQVDGGLTREQSGVGLGLAIAKRLIEMMGGKIWIESALGKGSTFYFTLNLIQTA
ncbi:MAG: HAMP domain-containing protein [Deltaproteobacteria bacterium]|nr:HAMP domain-containing protein [Deltaproteobacteria bacterium]